MHSLSNQSHRIQLPVCCETIIGKSSRYLNKRYAQENRVIINNDSIIKRHCRIQVNSKYIDCEVQNISKNGKLFVNNYEVKSGCVAVAKNGDTVTIGKIEFKYVIVKKVRAKKPILPVQNIKRYLK